MLLSAVAETIEAKIPQVCSFSSKGLAVPIYAILQNFVKSFASKCSACVLKEFIAQFRIESDSPCAGLFQSLRGIASLRRGRANWLAPGLNKGAPRWRLRR